MKTYDYYTQYVNNNENIFNIQRRIGIGITIIALVKDLIFTQQFWFSESLKCFQSVELLKLKRIKISVREKMVEAIVHIQILLRVIEKSSKKVILKQSLS